MSDLLKKLTFALLFLSGMILTLAARQNVASAATPKEAIKAAVEAKLPKKAAVKKIFYEDYDRNGRAEAFILSGPKDEKRNPHLNLSEAEHTLWFGYQEEDGSVQLMKIRTDVLLEGCKRLKLESATLFCSAWYVTTSIPMDVYLVQGNEAKKIFSGNTIQPMSGNDFSSVHSTYDIAYDSGVRAKLGHTWKPYYFYYKDGAVYQYKAKRISLARFKKYRHAASILKKHKKYGKIKSILLRSNGMVHINYASKSAVEEGGYYTISYYTVTLQVKDEKLKKKDVQEGTYKAGIST